MATQYQYEVIWLTTIPFCCLCSFCG